MRPTRNVPIGKLKNPKTIRISVEGDEVAEIGRGTIVLQKTRNVKADLTLSTSVVADKLEWKTRSSWLHWDLNPWVWTSGDEGIDYKFEEFIEENNGSRNDGNLKLQGLITLVESRSGDGGFCCVPGFHHNLKAYCENSRNTEYVEKNRFNYTFVNVPPGDRLHSETVHISTRAGSLIIWNSELPHCNCPNESSRIRMNQYIKMFPAHEGYPGTNVRREIMKQFVAKFEVTLLGRRLFGLERW
eukprot:TRINITY_DN188_c0_g1_i22.p1 TRINITY_DN188_c0_g1~~TRINITY_DN188_c0_g1_i22.p1  ORF type:complete len:243 (-),score=50.81 TRINITY_DN188_c0_g1_i22:105-833(-)